MPTKREGFALPALLAGLLPMKTAPRDVRANAAADDWRVGLELCEWMRISGLSLALCVATLSKSFCNRRGHLELPIDLAYVVLDAVAFVA